MSESEPNVQATDVSGAELQTEAGPNASVDLGESSNNITTSPYQSSIHIVF